MKPATAQSRFSILPYLNSTLFVGLAIVAGIVLDQALDVQNLALVFLMAVLRRPCAEGWGPPLCFPCLVPLRSIFLS